MLAYCRGGASDVVPGDGEPAYPFDEQVYTTQFQTWLGKGSVTWCAESSVDSKTNLETRSGNAGDCSRDSGGAVRMVTVQAVPPVWHGPEDDDCFRSASEEKEEQDDDCFRTASEKKEEQALVLAETELVANSEDTSVEDVGQCAQWCWETAAMHREDLAAWWQREREQRQREHNEALDRRERERNTAEDSRGRVILKASLTCLDSGAETLECRLLELHLNERETDAARHFLHDLNNLKPQRVRQYLGPLTSWLREAVQSATDEIAVNSLHVTGDLEDMVRLGINS
jgi:hypothetical protein